jgi:hypothetical protein
MDLGPFCAVCFVFAVVEDEYEYSSEAVICRQCVYVFDVRDEGLRPILLIREYMRY